MILTGPEIVKQVVLGNIEISDFDKKRVNPNSYNLRLHNELLCYTGEQEEDDQPKSAQLHIRTKSEVDHIDMKKKNKTAMITIPESGFILMPSQLYLGRTMERTRIDGFAPQIEGRSSIARLGIDVHKTAGWGDNGFDNYWTLEITATIPVKIYPFVDFCQIIFMTLEGDTSMKYKGKYQCTSQIDGSKIYEEFH
jgi:dCTP deaminase